MSSSSSSSEIAELDELNYVTMEAGISYRLELAPHEDDVQEQPRRYAVLYLHPDYEDRLLVVEASGGTAGIVETITPEKTVGTGDPLYVAWQDNNGDQWKVEGMCVRILRGSERELPNPLKEQLGIKVVSPAPYKPTGGIWGSRQ